MEKQNNEHDVGYKFLLSKKQVFLQLLRSFVKRDWVNQIEETHVERVDKSYILQDFHEKEADLVYKVKWKDQHVIFYILMELQSKVDYQMPYRLLLYMTEIWRNIVNNSDENVVKRKSFRLPVIVPFILYNGPKEWTVPLQFADTLNHADTFSNQAFNFSYILLDVNYYKKEYLLQISNLMSSVFILDQKAKDANEIFNRLNQIVDTLKQLPPKEFSLFKTWLKQIVIKRFPKDNRKKVEDLIDQTNTEEVEKMISGFEENIKKLVETGEETGEKAGEKKKAIEIAQKLFQDGTNIKLIAKYTGLTEEEIKKNCTPASE